MPRPRPSPSPLRLRLRCRGSRPTLNHSPSPVPRPAGLSGDRTAPLRHRRTVAEITEERRQQLGDPSLSAVEVWSRDLAARWLNCRSMPHKLRCQMAGNREVTTMIKLLGLFALALLLSTGWSNAAPTNQTQVAQVEQRPSCFNRCAAKQICPRCNGGGRCCSRCCANR
jgi:hypothetical protein